MQRSKNSSSLVGNHDRPPHVFLTELAGWSDQSSSNWRAQANPGRTTPLNAQERGFWVLLTKILRAWRLASLFFVGASYHFWAKKSWNRKSIAIETYKSRTIRQWKWCQAKLIYDPGGQCLVCALRRKLVYHVTWHWENGISFIVRANRLCYYIYSGIFFFCLVIVMADYKKHILFL